MTDRLRMLAPGRRAMTVRAADLERIEEPDPHPDLSWLDPDVSPAEANAVRLAACRADERRCARTAFLVDLGHGAPDRRDPRPVRQRPGASRPGVRRGGATLALQTDLPFPIKPQPSRETCDEEGHSPGLP